MPNPVTIKPNAWELTFVGDKVSADAAFEQIQAQLATLRMQLTHEP
jgi:hypothetical protein